MQAARYWFPALVFGVVVGWLLSGQVERQRALDAEQALGEKLQRLLSAEREQFEHRIESDAERLRIADASIQALSERLDSAERRSLNDARDLALFRRIASGELPRGLVVDSVRRLPGSVEKLLITLVHSQGRDRISGRLGLELLVADRGEVPASYGRESLSDVVSRPEDSLVLISPMSADAPGFDLRFFQTLEIALPAGVHIPEQAVLRITASPAGKRYKRTLHQVDWRDLLTVERP